MALDPILHKYVSSQESYNDKDIIIEEGGHGDWVYLILEGQVKVKKKADRKSLTITTLKAGSVFGELIYLQGKKGPRTASIVADGPVTVGLLNIELIEKEYSMVSPLLKKIISNLTTRLQDSTNHLVSLYIKGKM